MHFVAHRRLRGMIPWLLSATAIAAICLLVTQKTWRASACQPAYDLLNPSLPCETSPRTSEWEYESLRDALIEKIGALQQSKKINHVSVYFRDLNNGPRFGIEEYEKFYPASLLKVPLMIAILHAADRQPSILDERLTSPASLEPVANVEEPQETIQPNTTYSVRELLEKMIRYSDNDSANLLIGKLNGIPPPLAHDTFLDLGIKSMMDGSVNYVSIQSYAHLFGILYNAGYLSRDLSQMGLSLLSQTTFHDGIAAGMPSNIRIAHKFGYRVTSEGEHQLHDCGIVYHPSTSYTLCIMTSGADIKNDATAIADLSRIVYEHISSLTGKNP